MIGRRGFITGLVSLVAAPAIVRAGSLMPVKTMLIDDRLNMSSIQIINRVMQEFGQSPIALFDIDAAFGEMVRIHHVTAHWLVRR